MFCLNYSVYPRKVTNFIATLAKNRSKMRVERELAGFALPFAAVSAAVIFIGISPYCIITVITAFIFSLLTISILLHPVHHRMNSTMTWACIILLAGSTGAICGFTGLSLPPLERGSLVRCALSVGEGIRHEIMSINFKHTETNAILNALLTGDRSMLGREMVSAFRDSGASHILALSGLHLGMIYSIVLILLKPLGNTPAACRTRGAVTILSCGFYTLAVGAGPSIVRALLFITIGETARIFRRHRTTGSTLMAALVIQLMASPADIRSAGFQLSYAAMAGIAWIYPWLKGLWGEGKGFPIMKRIWNSLSMSIACQITTAPLAYLHFRSIPSHFMLTNLIAIPLTGLIIPCSLITLTLSACGFCPDVLIDMTEALVTIMTRALTIISNM